MRSYQYLNATLNSLIPFPNHIPVAYVIGDTGSGKSSLIRQMIGTASYKFPATRVVRTTVAPTEYVISPLAPLRAAFVLKPEKEIFGHIEEILEGAISSYFEKGLSGPVEEKDLIVSLGESRDQRFRLRYIIGKDDYAVIAQTIRREIIPKLAAIIGKPEGAPQPLGPVVEWELRRSLKNEFTAVRDQIAEAVFGRVRHVCSLLPDQEIPESVAFDGSPDDLPGFIGRVKEFLGMDGSISPIVERARISGNLKAHWLQSDSELIIIDSEGIGHNLQDQTLSARHLDYFYDADAILLIENGSKPFVGQAKSALRGIIENAYSSKLILMFTHLDRVDADEEGRESQVNEVYRSLLNAEQAIRQDGVNLHVQDFPVFYLGEMDQEQPDEESRNSLLGVVEQIGKKHKAYADQFIPPVYNYGFLREHLHQASWDFRACWEQYLGEDSQLKKPWQSVKAFNRRMFWGKDEYQDLKPVAQLHRILIKNLDGFLNRPDKWAQAIGVTKQQACLVTLKQEVSKEVLALMRQVIIANKHLAWEEGAELSGIGSTFERSKLIYEIICDCAPVITDNHYLSLAEAIQGLMEECIHRCKERGM